MCHGCHSPLPATGIRFMQTIATATGGTDIAFCTDACRQDWTSRRQRPATTRKAA